MEKEKRAAKPEMALQLQPNFGEAHHALGLCYYWFDYDYDKALREFAIGRALSPNDSMIPFHVAAIMKRQGHWAEAEFMRELSPWASGSIRRMQISSRDHPLFCIARCENGRTCRERR